VQVWGAGVGCIPGITGVVYIHHTALHLPPMQGQKKGFMVILALCGLYCDICGLVFIMWVIL
jgi:hypothetical protein